MHRRRLSKKILWNLRMIEKLYAFFEDAEHTRRRFTIHDIHKEVGYSLTTADSYRTKKWFWFLKKDGDTYYSDGLHALPKHIFISLHKQKPDDVIHLLIEQARPQKFSSQLKLLFLLLLIAAWYRRSRTWRVRLSRKYWMPQWRVYIPLCA